MVARIGALSVCIIVKGGVECTYDVHTGDCTSDGITIEQVVSRSKPAAEITSMLNSLYSLDDNDDYVNAGVTVTDVCNMQSMHREFEHMKSDLLTLKTQF